MAYTIWHKTFHFTCPSGPNKYFSQGSLYTGYHKLKQKWWYMTPQNKTNCCLPESHLMHVCFVVYHKNYTWLFFFMNLRITLHDSEFVLAERLQLVNIKISILQNLLALFSKDWYMEITICQIIIIWKIIIMTLFKTGKKWVIKVSHT